MPVDIEAFARRNAHITDDEIARDIADTERELWSYLMQLTLVEKNIADRKAFIEELKALQEWRRKGARR